jgi:hypothetical protein
MPAENQIVTIVGPESAKLTHRGLREFVFCTGDANAIRADNTDRRFLVVQGAGDSPATPVSATAIRELITPRVKTATMISLIAACRAADRDIERLGVLTATTVDMIRDALAEADAV